MNMIYRWKDAPGAPKIDAQSAGEELERIRVRNNGRLEGCAVVEAARPADAPLHPAFEWDDAAAAEMWRLEQARHVIKMITVDIEKGNGEIGPIRAFVSVVRDQDRSYTSVEHAMTDSELRAQVIAQAWGELEAWRNRHAELIEFAKVFSMIDQARAA